MKLNQLASKPQLIKLTIDDEETVQKFGEPLEFWTWDRQPLDVFMKLASADNTNIGNMIDITKTLILDEDGRAIIDGEITLPSNVLISAIAKITETLGK